MPRPLKVYTIQTANSFPSQDALRAVKARPHVSQGIVYVVASSKAAVVRQIEAQGFMHPVRPSVIQEAMGNNVAALKDARLLEDEGTVLVQNKNARHIAKRQDDGRFEYLGEIERKHVSGSYEYTDAFVPATPEPTGRITWTTTPESRSRNTGYLVEAFGTLGGAQPFTIFRGGNGVKGFTYEVRFEMAEVGHETTGPFTTRKEAEDGAERILADFLDAAGLTWKDSE